MKLQITEPPAHRSKLEQIYEAYRGLMFYTAKKLLDNDQDAEDAVQDAILKLAKNIDQISDPVCPKTRAYIVLTVESVSIDLLRKRSRQPTVPLEETPGLAADYKGDNALARCILALPAQDREILLLRFWQGYSVQEAARMLGISGAAARKREQRAKKKLEALCREEELL